MPKVLMVAFHYPPFQGGSGVHRTLKFSQYLPGFGWQPIIISANSRAYPKIGTEELKDIPSDLIVERPFALDTAKHLSICGRYSRLLALPDQWATWWLDAVRIGLKLIHRHQPKFIWSTYPIATAHLIGLTLHRLTDLPWIADFRDSMTEENYPRDRWSRQTYLWIERRAARYASRLIFTAESTRRMYLERYPDLSSSRCVLISNGFDEEDFAGIGIGRWNRQKQTIRLVHAGLIYTDDRDPRAFFRALSRLKKDGLINATALAIDLRASGSEAYYADLLRQLGIDDVVRLLPALSHRQALQDCAESDGFLLFQAASCNHQIPAKVYEYLRLGKPILALTPPEGDTGRLLLQVGGSTVIDLADEERIYQTIPSFIDALRAGRHAVPDEDQVFRFSRKYQSMQLAACLSELAKTH
jgi:glycosyltransferase involved in cell wall biosynthesis